MSAETFMNEVSDYAEEVVDLAKNFEFEDLYPDESAARIMCRLCQPSKYTSGRGSIAVRNRPVTTRGRDRKAEEGRGTRPQRGARTARFVIWKDKSGRYVDRRTVHRAARKVANRVVLDGFLTRQGRTRFEGQLAVVEGEIDLKRLEGGESGEDDSVGMPEYEVDERPLITCP